MVVSKQSKHPAPLPLSTVYSDNATLKLPPPVPLLKTSKVPHGIIVSWNMTLDEKFAEIESYQLYAYKEVPEKTPSTSMWKKVGDIRALKLPMACTLAQFSEGINYYFAVRAVDVHSRLGEFSQPAVVSL